jgi:hypothetical protein
MTFLQAFLNGFSITLGVEVALGLCLALGKVFKGANKE